MIPHCIHRSKDFVKEPCVRDRVAFSISVYQCDIHGRCAIKPPIPIAKTCLGCRDYKSGGIDDPAMLAHIEKQWGGCKGCGHSRPDEVD